MVSMLVLGLFGGLFLAKQLLPQTTVVEDLTLQDCIVFLLGLVAIIWGIAITVFMGRVYWKGLRRLPGIRLLFITLLPLLFIPYQPVVYGAKTDWSRYDVWELWKTVNDIQKVVDEATSKQTYQLPFDYEAAIYRQRDLVERMLSGIKPSDEADKTNIFFLAAAPYASQDVFKREVAAVKDLFDSRFGTSKRSAMLINHRDTVGTLPMANATNLEFMLTGFAKSMNVDRDVLVLFLTTHGSKGVMSVAFPGFTFNDLTPDALAAILDNAGIKNRVLILSACHSGSFLPRLKNENTIVMAAAHADKTSFGCSNEREWTYFGDALFNHALRNTYSLEDAFAKANRLITTWEHKEDLTPSEPQIFVGANIGKKWTKIATDLQSRTIKSVPGVLSQRASRHLLAASHALQRASLSRARLDPVAQGTN